MCISIRKVLTMLLFIFLASCGGSSSSEDTSIYYSCGIVYVLDDSKGEECWNFKDQKGYLRPTAMNICDSMAYMYEFRALRRVGPYGDDRGSGHIDSFKVNKELCDVVSDYLPIGGDVWED
ncbi:MAG: hypothetical protein KBT77_12250 [Thalassolituus oleivorans]|uniref:hypothetical protein n=1 Tax=Thalassolituus oleivorans TaxID=187493 RepID=UPI001B4C6133|nr:hypothetical protein [Thalassolituus oleivorans]MBQ0728106.1 hypothetical protein [Thalassolituus oleivorans]MBQ0780309.1 hypothetical protein [Thalassolituus oleivorans]